MSQKKVEKYGLYYTFSSNIPEEELSEKDINNLISKTSSLSYEQKCAFFMLICEHARLNEQFQYDEEEGILPYSINQEENNILIDFSKIPRELQWILFKFSNIIKNPEEM